MISFIIVITTLAFTLGAWAAPALAAHVYTLEDSGCGGGPYADNAYFNISDDELRTSAVLDFDTKDAYTICIRTTDAELGTYDEEFTIAINDIVISKADQAITFDALPDRTYGDADFTLSATASSGLAVSFASTTTSVCTVSGSTVSLVGVGTCSITASRDGDGNYNPAPDVSQNFNVLASVTPSAGTGGSISPDTVQTVVSGDSVSFTILPATGYYVALPVGGTCGGATTGGDAYDTAGGISYATDAITSDCTVEASFISNQYTVTAYAGVNGVLDASTSSPQTVASGGTVRFTFNADTGYHIASIRGCGINYMNGDKTVTTHTVTTGAVTSDCTVSAIFSVNLYLLSVTVEGEGEVAGDSGAIACPGVCSASYNYGTMVTLALSADTEGKFLGWSGDADCEDGMVTMTTDVDCTAKFCGFPWELIMPAIIGGAINEVPFVDPAAAGIAR